MESDEAADENDSRTSDDESNFPLADQDKQPDSSNPDYAERNDLLRGDAIGNTLYSERYVLKILMKLSEVTEVDWSEEFETELSNLWDMTMEHDVVTFLMKYDFLKLATSLLQGPFQEPRFIEIIVGILRNMCCFEEVRLVISERPELTQLLVQLLSTSDTLTLVQLVKLFHSVAWDLVKQVDQRSCTSQKHWLEKQMDCQLLCDKLSFLLRSSTNDELLYGVLDVLYTLCTYGLTVSDKDFSQYFATIDMVGSLLECWQQLFVMSSTMDEGDGVNNIDDDDIDNNIPDESELFLSKFMFKAAKKWVAVLASFVGHEKGREALISNGDPLSTIMAKLIRLQAEDERCEEMLMDVVNIMEALIPSHFVPDIVKKLLTILYDMTQQQGDILAIPEKLTLIDSFENFFESALRIGSKAKLCEALKVCEGEDHLILLFWSVIEKRDPDLMIDWKSDIKPFDERSI